MKLEKIHWTDFRSVEDGDEFCVGPVACLVGKNHPDFARHAWYWNLQRILDTTVAMPS